MNGSISFGAFLRSNSTGPITVQSEAWTRLKRAWWPFLILILLFTIPSSPLSLASRLIVIAVLLGRLLNLRGHLPLLDRWGARAVELGAVCAAFSLSLAERNPLLLMCLPPLLALSILYLHYNYLKWKVQEEKTSLNA